MLTDSAAAIKGTYILDAAFISPGEHTNPIGLELTVFDICDASTFPKAPVISLTSSDYYINNGKLEIGITWDQDTVSASTGVSCGGY